MAEKFKFLSQKVHETLGEAKRCNVASNSNKDDADHDCSDKNWLIEAFGDNDVTIWIDLFANYPTLQNITFLRAKLDKRDPAWIARFLEESGLEAMFLVLETFTNKSESRGTIPINLFIYLSIIIYLSFIQKLPNTSYNSIEIKIR